MVSRLPNLMWLRTFETSARHLNFTEAGKELGLTQAAVSLHVRSLEATLNCQLFLRRPRRLELTAMGHAYAHSIRQSLSDIDVTTSSLFGTGANQTVTLRAPISTATLFLAARLPEFMKTHPDISIRMISVIWTEALQDEDVDVDLRLGHGNWQGVEADKISTETVVPLCSAAIADRIGTPIDLLGFPLIHILGHEDHWERYLAPHGLNTGQGQVRYLVDTTTAAVALVCAGDGIAMGLSRFVETSKTWGAVVVPNAKPVEIAQAHYLTSPFSGDANKLAATLFKTWLRECFQETMPN